MQAFPTVPAAHKPPPPTSWGAVNTCAVACRSEDERLQFMRGLQDVWSVSGRPVLGAFDLSPFPLICDVGGEPLPCTPEQGLRAGDLGAPGGEGQNMTERLPLSIRGQASCPRPTGRRVCSPSAAAVHPGAVRSLCITAGWRCRRWHRSV